MSKPFHVKLTSEHRARLEAFRAARGLRSESDAVRVMIEEAAQPITAGDPAHSVDEVKLTAGAPRLEVDPPAKPLYPRATAV